MDREFWLDGFNFFHHWELTRGFLRADSGLDIVDAMSRSLRILSRRLGRRGRWTVVFLDGGLSRGETRSSGLRVRFCGPGRKADDRLVDDLEDLGPEGRMVTAVSNDRELKARMRTRGAACLGVGEFLALIEGKPRGKNGAKAGGRGRPGRSAEETDAVMREKCRTLSASEVEAWLEFFGGEAEG